MATYVTYNNLDGLKITILNFIMVDNLEDIVDNLNFQQNSNLQFNDKVYIAIKNKTEDYDPTGYENFQNLSVCTSDFLPDSNEAYSDDGIWKSGTIGETIVFTLQESNLNNMFHNLTRFSERELRISNNNEVYKTLENTIIFIGKENIKNLFKTVGLNNLTNRTYTNLNEVS